MRELGKFSLIVLIAAAWLVVAGYVLGGGWATVVVSFFPFLGLAAAGISEREQLYCLQVEVEKLRKSMGTLDAQVNTHDRVAKLEAEVKDLSTAVMVS